MNAAIENAKDHFELFGLPVQYTLDRQLLSSRYLELTRATHPDFAPSDPDSQLRAMELAARINEAHATLEDDLARAGYLHQLKGGEVGDLKLGADTLERVFDLRDRLSHAQTNEDEAAAAEVCAQAQAWLNELLHQVGQLLDGQATPASPLQISRLLQTARYVKKVCTA